MDRQCVPRNIKLITGAGGTTDIEGSFVLGAHQPRYLQGVTAGGEVSKGTVMSSANL